MTEVGLETWMCLTLATGTSASPWRLNYSCEDFIPNSFLQMVWGLFLTFGQSWTTFFFFFFFFQLGGIAVSYYCLVLELNPDGWTRIWTATTLVLHLLQLLFFFSTKKSWFLVLQFNSPLPMSQRRYRRKRVSLYCNHNSESRINNTEYCTTYSSTADKQERTKIRWHQARS